MLDAFAPLAPATDLTIPAEHRRGVGVVGAGAIVEVAHLPAYQRAGIDVRGITDLDASKAARLGARFAIPAVSGLDALLADPQIEVIDIAVHPRAQPEIADKALRAGKHVLAQKPLAQDSAIAADLVELATASGRSLVVNHQMRYGEGMAASRAMAEAGWVGEVTAVLFDVNISTDWGAWPWLLTSPRLDLMYHSIHYFDSIRALLGTPEHVFCAAGRRPGQQASAETRTMTTMLYPDGRRAHVNVNHENITGDYEARFRIDGSAGSIRGTIGLLYDYPHGRPDTVEVNSSVLPTDGWLTYPVTTRWIPDAFAGPMRALLAEVAARTPSPTTGADALRTLEVVEACYASADKGQVEAVRTR
jgi:predicted dehydrogenase